MWLKCIKKSTSRCSHNKNWSLADSQKGPGGVFPEGSRGGGGGTHPQVWGCLLIENNSGGNDFIITPGVSLPPPLMMK